MRVLVTGGSGFIGTDVVETLLTRGFEVTNYDSKPPRESERGSLWQGGDVRDAGRLRDVVCSTKPHAIVHLAAKAEMYTDRWADFTSIHVGTRNLLDAIDSCGGVDRLVNVSTQLVIGPGYQPRSLLDYRPYTVYGEAKAYAEALLLQWRSPVHWLTVRPANIWGPYHPTFADAIGKVIRERTYLHPASRKPVMRSYGYVQNAAEQIVTLMEADRSLTDRQVFYVADEVMDSAIWVDAFAFALTGRPAHRAPVAVLKPMGWFGDALARIGLRIPIDSGRVMRMTVSYPVPIKKTIAITGPPKVSLETGVSKTVSWLRSRSSPDRHVLSRSMNN